MAIGKIKKPIKPLAETTTPITTGVTQAISNAVPGVLQPGQAATQPASSMAAIGGTQAVSSVAAMQPASAAPIQPAPSMTDAVGGGIGFTGTDKPAIADQAGDMMTPTPQATPGIGELVGQFQEQADAARAANEKRYAQGLSIHEQMVGDFGQGGTMEAAAMQRYQQQKQQDLASQTQHMVSSGLYGTTMPGTMATSYEQQVGVPYKMQLDEVMAQRKAEAMRGQAGFIERREDIPPSPELMASLVQTASARPEEDAAAGATEAPAQTSIWGSGQTGAVTAEQFSKEAQRQQYSKAYEGHVAAYESQIESYKKAAAQHEPGSTYNAHFIKLMEDAKKNLKEAEKNVKKYGESEAGISSVQYAEEEQRRTSASTQRQAPASQINMSGVGRGFVGGRAGQTGPIMPSFASSGSGWGSFGK